MDKDFSNKDKLFILFSSIFVSLLILSNILAVKIIDVGGLVGPAAVLIYALSFALSDTLVEIWGEEKVKYVIKVGFIASLISAIFIRLAISFPSAENWTLQQEFEMILGSNLRIVFASMVAYLASQFHDVWAFVFWKKLTKGKHLWLRNNLSTIFSQMIDTVIFIFIAFYGSGLPILSMMIGQYILKLIIALLDTPIVYLAVKLTKENINLPVKESTNFS
ncbi:MAG: queuosine precursor transporter [Bacillota bacterium]